ncbi:MAG: hypothetical protein HND47_02460 [Chloroflexi bacterium]|nr:hypothetical protein [Chloroflexota bacterium]
MENTQNKTGGVWFAIGVIVFSCFACLVLAGLGGFAYFNINGSLSSPSTGPVFITPFTVTQEPEVTRPPVETIQSSTLETLETTIVPVNDPREIACRLNGICNVPEVMAVDVLPRTAGDRGEFWVHNLDTNKNNRVTAVLQYVTQHAYFWVQDGVEVDSSEVRALMESFENDIYPTTREFFGSEWSPGIDGDEHIYILYARGLGSSIAGYFSSSDSSHPLVNQYSNAHEMFLFNADNTFLGSDFTYGVLAHEFQHMIHWYNDLNETSWLNEGSSELASFINGFDPGGAGPGIHH